MPLFGIIFWSEIIFYQYAMNLAEDLVYIKLFC